MFILFTLGHELTETKVNLYNIYLFITYNLLSTAII